MTDRSVLPVRGNLVMLRDCTLADADLLEHEEWIARETLAVSVEASGAELRFEKA